MNIKLSPFQNAMLRVRKPIKERNLGISLAVPDMSLDLRELLNRHKSGNAVRMYQPQYVNPDSNVLPVNFERLDKIERRELLRSLPDFVQATRGRLMSAREAAKRALRSPVPPVVVSDSPPTE